MDVNLFVIDNIENNTTAVCCPYGPVYLFFYHFLWLSLWLDLLEA